MSNEFMQIGLPANIKVTNEFGHLRIVWRWFHIKYIFMTLVVIILDGCLLTLYATPVRDLLSGNLDLNIIPMLLLLLLHGTVCIGVTYFMLAGYVNRTVIDVDFDRLTVKSGPLPVWGNKKIPSRTLRQLYVKGNTYSDMGTIMTYAVRAITDDQRNIKLLGGLDSTEQALFIEQEIEKFLHIEDKPIKGQVDNIVP
jgi:hypothetical protein